jgi:hypothetical protein
MQCVRPRAKDGGGLTWFATFLKKKKMKTDESKGWKDEQIFKTPHQDPAQDLKCIQWVCKFLSIEFGTL